MRNGLLLGTAALTLTLVGVAAEPIKSGPQPGGEVPAFHSLNLTGASAGKKACQV